LQVALGHVRGDFTQYRMTETGDFLNRHVNFSNTRRCWEKRLGRRYIDNEDLRSLYLFSEPWREKSKARASAVR
jgi:hypothetical protein